MNAQLETLRKADRVLTRDPEIVSLIGSSDDDLLYELRKESAEEKLNKGAKKEEREKENLDFTPPEMPKESPKAVVEQPKPAPQPIKEEKKVPAPAPANAPHAGPPSPQHVNPPAAPGGLPAQAQGKPAANNLFGTAKKP